MSAGLFLSLSLSACLPACLPACLSVCLSASLYLYLSVPARRADCILGSAALPLQTLAELNKYFGPGDNAVHAVTVEFGNYQVRARC